MAEDTTKETTGAWIVHHGRKIALDASGAAEFPVIDEVAKAANLLARLGSSTTASLSKLEVGAIARSAQLN